MGIKRIEIEDLLVFKGVFVADFCNGVNVLIGENATGKTTLLKVLYWACEHTDMSSYNKESESLRFRLHFLKNYFSGQNDSVIYSDANSYSPILSVSEGVHIEACPTLNVCFTETTITDTTDIWGDKKKLSVFIPTTEMLSHSRGFLALNRERPIPFDKTEIDIISKAELEPTRDLTPNASKALDTLASIIGGAVIFDGKEFYVEKVIDGRKIPFSFEAGGYRKIGLLWKLLRNGLLESGSILFWDEPENSLNPNLVPVLVSILLELSHNGVQVFIATHDYNVARYFDVRSDKYVPVMFHNLSKNEDAQIVCESSPKYIKLQNNPFETASTDLFKAVVNAAWEVQGNE